jgi:hypothetical protein
VGDILFSSGKSKRERKRLLEELRQTWEKRLSKIDLSADKPGAYFLSECCRLTDDQWDGLFHCFSNPRIPGTNNGTEQFIGQLKSLERVLAKNPNPGARFIRNAPINAAFVNRRQFPGKTFIAGRTPDEMAAIRQARKKAAHKVGVARLARKDIHKLLDRLKKQWTAVPKSPPDNRNTSPCRLSAS